MDTTLANARTVRDTLLQERFAGLDQNPNGVRDLTTCVVSGVERLKSRLEATQAAEERALEEAKGAQDEVRDMRHKLIDARGTIEVLQADVARLTEQVRARETVLAAAWHWYRTGDGDALASALARIDRSDVPASSDAD